MVTIPDEKEIPGRKDLREKFYVAGGVLIALAAASAYFGNGKVFVVSAALGGLSIFIGTKVKTHRKLISHGGLYK